MKALFYHSPFKGNKEPRVTVCGLVQENLGRDDVSVSIGLSRCSEKDPFNKKKGRVIAVGRAMKNPTSHFVVSKGTELKKFYNVAESLADEVIHHPEYV